MGRLRIAVSSRAADRLAAAAACLARRAPGTRVLVVGSSRGAADDFVRTVAARVPATFGIDRLSLTQVASRAALAALAADGVAPSSWLGAEAVATRAAFEAARAGGLEYFAPVAATPGFPRALARTLQELRLAAVPPARLQPMRRAGGDVARLLERFEAGLAGVATVDRAALLRVAAAAVARRPPADAVVLLDLPLEHDAERVLVQALVAGSAEALATVPRADAGALEAFVAMGGEVDVTADADDGDLASLRRHLFVADLAPPERSLDGTLEFFSAPGEGREAIEIARRIHREAARGVRFDQMAILLRSPETYAGLLEQALARADVPAWFDRGTRRPHPAGRAFLSLLACAAEHLSAARFAEYLSLGQVPRERAGVEESWTPPVDEALGRPVDRADDETERERQRALAEPTGEGEAVVGGAVPAPWRWERLLVEASVIGGDPARWTRRLDGIAGELARQATEAGRDDGDDARRGAAEQTLAQLQHLRAFAVPVVERLAAWPREGAWGAWLDRFEALVPDVLRAPAHVLRVLAELRPMADVGPVSIDEVRRVLAERLLTVEAQPPSRRYGRVFVGSPEQARGRSFTVVFVPGLAERLFPQRPREDALLLDELRTAVDPALATQRHRLHAERVRLQVAVGTAEARLYVSYPRIEISESRARVPSFYALDVMRAATGRVPDQESLEKQAREAGDALLAWPAPTRPDDAIDEQEHDLAVLRGLLDESEPARVRGHAHYLLKLNEPLRRSVIDRWARGDRRWSPSDGLTRVTASTREALAGQRLTARAYSLSALQRFSACPYQFVLSAVYRLHPLDRAEPLQRLDPLTRGSLFHQMQERCLRALRDRGALPVSAATEDAARVVLDGVIDETAAQAHEELAPAVERVWLDEVTAMRRDLHGWLTVLVREGDEWTPTAFEMPFGDVPGRDAEPARPDVVLADGFRLRGAIDLIETHRQTGLLRVTDHKTGRKPDRIEKVVVGGGAVLQPVLYGLAAEAALGGTVRQGRLFYCTANGGFQAHEIPLNDHTRAEGLDVLRVIDRAIASGFLAAAPTDDACGRCDYRPVCGPDVARRVARKAQEPLADLLALREMP